MKPKPLAREWRSSGHQPRFRVSEGCGSNSVVECHLAKVDVEGSNPFSRSGFLGFSTTGGTLGRFRPTPLPTPRGRLPGGDPVHLSDGVSLLRVARRRVMVVHLLRLVAADRARDHRGEADHASKIVERP